MYMYMYIGVLTSESQGLAMNAFVLALDMPNFRLLVAMAADFCSLVVLIPNTLLGEIMISST